MGQRELPSLVYLHDADVTARGAEALGRLADQFDVLAPGYPGFEGRYEERDRAWEDWDSGADLAFHMREELGLTVDEPVHVLGAGLGGWVALELALFSPWLLRSLVLVAPYGVKLSGRMEPEFADILLLDSHEQIERGWADPARCHSIRMPGFPQSGDDAQHEAAFAERATLARYVWKPFLHSPLLRRWLHQIDVPVLVVGGAEDRMVRSGHGQELVDLLPRARYIEIPDAGHYPYLEQPDRFAETVEKFYAELTEVD